MCGNEIACAAATAAPGPATFKDGPALAATVFIVCQTSATISDSNKLFLNNSPPNVVTIGSPSI